MISSLKMTARRSQRQSVFPWSIGALARIPRWLLVIACFSMLWCQMLAQSPSGQSTTIPSGPYRVAGKVVSEKIGNVLARTRVTITDVKNRHSLQSMITGDDGRFEFRVPAGKFSLEGAKRGFINASYNQHEQFSSAIVTGADVDTENLVFRLSQEAVLSGKVLDESGEPVANAQVMVYREQHPLGVSRTSRYRGAVTDDLGHYEVARLEEGTYFVSAKATPWYAIHPASAGDNETSLPTQVDSSIDVAYPTTYYGDVTEPLDATPIGVRGGDHLEADIHMNPVPALHLVVHVPEGDEVGVPHLYKPGFDGMEDLENGNLQGFGDGVYELSGIPAGHYTVQMPGAGQSKEMNDVNIESSGVLEPPSGKSMSQIKAAVQIAGTSKLPPQLWIVLNGAKGRINQPVDEKGEADFANVPAGKYDVAVGSQTRRYSVARITSEAGATSGQTLNVPAAGNLAIVLSVVEGAATVEGFAKRKGKPVSGVMIVLVPENVEANRDRLRRDESDLDGSFTLANVIPGSYTVIALEDGWDLQQWSEPAVVTQYLKHGQTLEVGNRPGSIHLADAVEVQSR